MFGLFGVLDFDGWVTLDPRKSAQIDKRVDGGLNFGGDEGTNHALRVPGRAVGPKGQSINRRDIRERLTVMRLVLAILGLLFVQSAFGQEFSTEDRFGKSVDQVLAMGHDKWYTWFTDSSRGAESTAGMAMAERIYADCLKVKNDEAKAKLSPEDKAYYDRIEKSMKNLVSNIADVGYAVTGGGTMWIPVISAAVTEVEQTVYDLLHGSKGKPASQSAVWAEYTKALKIVQSSKEDIATYANDKGERYGEAIKNMYKVNDEFNGIVNLSKNRQVWQKSLIFDCCKNVIGLVRSMTQPEDRSGSVSY